MDENMVVSCLKCSENIENSVLESMFCHELARSIILIILGVIVSFIFYFISQNVKRILRNASSMLMFALFLAIWMLGFITYSIGAHVGDTHPFWSNAPMAIIRATLMFAAQSDISAIKDDCTSSPAYMCLFNLSHLLAVLVSFAFVLRHFGFHVVSKLRLLHHAYISGNTDNLYIFWGFNDAAFSLARSIPRIDEKGDKNQILVVRTDDEDDFEGTKMPIKRLLHSISLKNRELGRLEKLECLNVSCFARLSKIDVNDKNKRTNVFGGLLRLPCIPKLICKTNKTVSFFLLNNSYDANYKALENLLQDSSIIKNKNKIKMYCHARRTQLTDVYNIYEKYNPEHVSIHLLDSSELAVRCLKAKDEALPVNHVVVDAKHACVRSPFKAVIIGFGETGQEALSFLYEYSALPQENGCQIERQFKIIDNRTDELESDFWFNHPGLDKKNNEIEFRHADICARGYYEGMEDDILDSQYFLVSLNDDDLNMSVATTIFDTLYRTQHRSETPIAIFVKAYDPDKLKWMKRIEYNKNNGDANFPCKIHIFGYIEEIFNYDLIIADILLKRAKQFHCTYESLCNSMKTEGEPEKVWLSSYGSVDKRISEYKTKKNRIVSKSEVTQEFYRKTEQNFSNSQHISTKLRLLGISDNDIDTITELNNVINTRKPEYLEYYNITDDGNVKLSEWNDRLLNCAKCEHLRWNAAHLMMGYQPTASYSDDTNDRYRLHNCLRNWDELNDYPEKERKNDLKSNDKEQKKTALTKSNDKTRSFDACVVDTSIRITFNKCMKKC